MEFDPELYGDAVARILSIEGSGNRLMPLVAQGCCSEQACKLLETRRPGGLFPSATHPVSAMAGLWLYFSGIDQAHELVQDDGSREASLWHAILHRQEPDSGNSAYWFRQAGPHPTHSALSEQARAILKKYPEAEFRASVQWDPFGFINFCERARQQPGSPSEAAALEIQRAEWQILFGYCARVKA